MRIPLTEPTAPRYITINHQSNQVHLMVPVVSGQEISTDNTCKAMVALRDFFGGGALHELTTYKNALAFDIAFLGVDNPQRVAKEARLAQIEAYIEAVSAMRNSYSDAMTAFLKRPSNLYGIQLRPRNQDSQSRVVNPAFNIERRNNASGIPLSALYNAMHEAFPSVVIGVTDARSRLTNEVLGRIPASPTFENIRDALTTQCNDLFGMDIDFTAFFKQVNNMAVKQLADKAHIDALMGFSEENAATPEDYINALLGTCAPDMWETIPDPASSFYSIPAMVGVVERTERLSIMTQFFLANLNIYCKSKGISAENFGTILDASAATSHALVGIVTTALSVGDDVEMALCAFCNANADKFRLTRVLNTEDIATIKQKFERTYHTVTVTKENPHMDDFMILDVGAQGETAKFVTHQGAICVDFAEIVDPVAASANSGYFASIRADFATHPVEIPQSNEGVAGTVDVDIEVLIGCINDEQLPEAVKVACRAHQTFQMRQFLHDVAKGHQDKADNLLTASPANQQDLLKTPGVFTDYSGRTFNCTAFEYAYWAKDTHMCRMLERHMDDETKLLILARIDEIECIDAGTGQPVGLVYSQGGLEHRSAHFNLTELVDALQRYIDGYDNWERTNNRDAIKSAWMEVGILQRDMPVHVLNEYCHPHRSFYPLHEFNEGALPRSLRFFNFVTGDEQYFFPLVTSDYSALGVDFALFRGSGTRALAAAGPLAVLTRIDLAAVSHLDEVRTADLTRSREYLRQVAPNHGVHLRVMQGSSVDF